MRFFLPFFSKNDRYKCGHRLTKNKCREGLSQTLPDQRTKSKILSHFRCAFSHDVRLLSFVVLLLFSLPHSSPCVCVVDRATTTTAQRLKVTKISFCRAVLQNATRLWMKWRTMFLPGKLSLRNWCLSTTKRRKWPRKLQYTRFLITRTSSSFTASLMTHRMSTSFWSCARNG